MKQTDTLISEKFHLRLKSSKKVPNHSWWIVLRKVIWHLLFWEKLSEIMPSLITLLVDSAQKSDLAPFVLGKTF
jgi:hypothetical protein